MHELCIVLIKWPDINILLAQFTWLLHCIVTYFLTYLIVCSFVCLFVCLFVFKQVYSGNMQFFNTVNIKSLIHTSIILLQVNLGITRMCVNKQHIRIRQTLHRHLKCVVYECVYPMEWRTLLPSIAVKMHTWTIVDPWNSYFFSCVWYWT